MQPTGEAMFHATLPQPPSLVCVLCKEVGANGLTLYCMAGEELSVELAFEQHRAMSAQFMPDIARFERNW